MTTSKISEPKQIGLIILKLLIFKIPVSLELKLIKIADRSKVQLDPISKLNLTIRSYTPNCI